MKPTRANTPLSREQALNSVPVMLDAVAREELDGKGLRLTVNLPRSRWQRWLGGTSELRRSFELDPLGSEVYNACDGRQTVKAMIEAFASAHHLSLAEAEMSVTQFLNMLMARGLVGMEVNDDADR